MHAPNLMIDLETLGLKPGCQILAVGIVPFGDTEECPHCNYIRISVLSYEEFPEFTPPDIETIDWWNRQLEEAKVESFGGTTPVKEALQKVADYISYFGPDVHVWGNAASFDLKILERAFEIVGIPVPWSYKNEMCYRTLKNLFPAIEFVKPTLAHTALSDALAQANHAERILTWQY